MVRQTNIDNNNDDNDDIIDNNEIIYRMFP